MPLTIQPSPTKNLVTNGDFSQGALGWTLHANASVVGGKLMLNATGASQASSQPIAFIPGATYQLKWTAGGFINTSNKPRINAQEQNASGGFLRSNHSIPTGDGDYVSTFTVGYDTKLLLLFCTNDGAGTFTFDNITLTRVQPLSPFRNLVPLFTDPAWSKHANTTTSPDGKTLTLNATAGIQTSSIAISVVPNTKLVYDIAIGGLSGHRVRIKRDSLIGADLANRQVAPITGEIVVPMGVTTIYILVENTSGSPTGTFTFSNLTLTKALPTFSSAKTQDFFKEILPFPSMNVDSDGNGIVDGWQSSSFLPNGAGAATWVNSFDPTEKAQKITMSASTAASVPGVGTNAGIPVTPKQTLEASVDIRTQNPTGLFRASFQVDYYNSVGSYMSSAFNLLVLSPTWTTFKQTLTVPAGVSTLRFALRASSAGAGDTGTIWFKNASLKRKAP